MNSMTDYAALIGNRELLYRFLSRLYLSETDNALLKQLTAMRFPDECGEAELAEGYRMMTAYLRRPGGDRVTELAVDYARVFLGAGVAEGMVAYPYESVYTSELRLMMQEARDQVLQAYRDKGLGCLATLNLPEDHLAFELEFMAHLCRTMQICVAEDDWSAALLSLGEQKNFVKRHLLNWVPRFCDDILKSAASDFYKAAAKITRGFMRLETAIIEDLIAEATQRRG